MVMNVDVAIAKLTAAWLLKNERPASGLFRTSSGALSPYRYGRARPGEDDSDRQDRKVELAIKLERRAKRILRAWDDRRRRRFLGGRLRLLDVLRRRLGRGRRDPRRFRVRRRLHRLGRAGLRARQ